MPLLHRFTSEAGDDMLVLRGGSRWTLVSREKSLSDGRVKQYVEVDFTDDEIIEFAEKILELTREQGG